MGKKNSAPKSPDPREVAQAQTASNIGTAIASSWMGNANEFSPYGNVVYNPTGFQNVTVDGQDYQVPQFERTMWLDPAEQSQLDQQRLLGYGMNNMAIGQVGRLDQLLSSPVGEGPDWPVRMNQVPTGPQFTAAPQGPQANGVNLPMLGEGGPIQGSVDQSDPRFWFGSAGSINRTFGQAGDIQQSIGPTDYSEDRRRVEEALQSRLNPQLERQRTQLETTLVNQGYTRGSEAFNNAMDEHTRQANDAQMQVLMAGGQEQSRLAGLALQSGQFANQAQAQEFAQNAQRGQFANAAQAQLYDQLIGRGQFYNQATDQWNASRLAGGQFANQAQQQGFAQDAQRTGLNQEGMLSQAGFNNAAQQQMWQNAMGQMEYDNQLRQLGFGNQTQQVQMQNALREQALQEDMALRNQPINEITALMSGSQVNVPQFSQYQGGQVGQVPVGQYMYNSAQMDQNNWANQQQVRSSLMGGLFDLGGTLGSAAIQFSDRRAKRGIERLGIKANGLDLYSYRYLWDNDNVKRVGVMADEVKRKVPAAVTRLGGYDTVDYTLAMAA